MTIDSVKRCLVFFIKTEGLLKYSHLPARQGVKESVGKSIVRGGKGSTGGKGSLESRK